MSDQNQQTASPPSLETLVTIWEKAVDTQMKFNEMNVKSRQLGLTFVAAALGVAILLLTRTDGKFDISKMVWGLNVRFHIAVLIVLAAAVAVWTVRFLDLKVYHEMLRGAVAFGEDFEETHLRPALGLQKGMTQAISHFSRHADARAVSGEKRTYAYMGRGRKNLEQKVKHFYNVMFASLLLSAVFLFWLTNSF